MKTVTGPSKRRKSRVSLIISVMAMPQRIMIVTSTKKTVNELKKQTGEEEDDALFL